LHTGVESNVGTIATTGTANIKGDYNVVEVVLDIGRKHQIRTQLSHLGHPIYGDIKYGGRYHIHQGRDVDSITYNTLSSVQNITIAK
jgi:23S rRNA-/tRNA-specific pseudouridylate synthase